jgi:hypothetical protein
MPFNLHTIQIPDGSQINNYDRVIVATQVAIANVAGGSNGAAVTTAVSFAPGSLPTNYFVIAQASQICSVTITNKTNSGFNVVLTPASTVTLAAGTFDVLVIA